jgi:hypothetical protein
MRIPRRRIRAYIRRYSLYSYDEKTEAQLKSATQERFRSGKRDLTKRLFLGIAAWKTPRQKRKYETNTSSLISDVTGISFQVGRTEKVRIEVLLVLGGVGYPVASTLLHFAFPDRYPILDFRAVWSLGMEQPSFYTFEFWWEFVERMRWESNKLGLTIRELDKALWAYSKENQPPAT